MQNRKLREFVLNSGFLFNKHRPLVKPNVLLYSIPRSGSTWLLELIWSQPDFKYANEPLNIKTPWRQGKSGINGFKELYTEEVREKVVSYFKGFVEGKHHFMNPNPLRKHSRLFTSRIVFKVIHGGEFFINDIAQQTNSKIVYLLRNPIAVALSRQQIPRTEELTSDFVLSKFSSDEQRFAKEIISNGSDMEKKIMLWCLQNKFALQQRTSNWLVLSYERLTCYPEKVLTTLAEHCELPDLETMIERVNIPSAVSIQSEDDSVRLMQEDSDHRKRLINRWRSKITDAEMRRYYEICDKMNFGIYTEDSEFINLENVL